MAVVDRCRTHENMMQLYKDWANWYGEDSAVQMCLVLRYESDYRLTVVGKNSNGSFDVGLFQINTGYHCPKVGEARNSDGCIAKLKERDANVQAARQIYEASGWSPWYGRKKWLKLFYVERITR